MPYSPTGNVGNYYNAQGNPQDDLLVTSDQLNKESQIQVDQEEQLQKQEQQKQLQAAEAAKTPEQKKIRHDRAVNSAMTQAVRHCYFFLPGHQFGTISQGALALKDVLRGPGKDLRTFVKEIEDEAVMFYGSKDKYFKATQCAFIRDFPDRVSVKHRDI